MYFIELIVKKFLKKKQEKQPKEIVPDFEQQELDEECEEHVFMPIDSTGEVLSCINCGLVVHKNELHNQNPF